VSLPGMESECQALFATACQAGLSKAAVEEKCQNLLRRYAESQAAEAKTRQQAADAQAKAAARTPLVLRSESRSDVRGRRAEQDGGAARTRGYNN
jgi:hypothetical protein